MEMTDVKETLLDKDELPSMSEEQFRKSHSFKPLKQPPCWKKISRNFQCNKSCVYNLVPILSWLPQYDFKNNFLADLIAGLTVSVLQIPHGLAFAPLAGQPPVVGLYMAVFPIIIYLVFGTSRHISLGMMAILIMMVGKIVETNSISNFEIQNGTIGYSAMDLGITVTFTVGLWQFLLGSLHLGPLCVLLSSSLVSAFTSGASIHIIFIQLKHIFGIQLSMSTGPLKLVFIGVDFLKNITQTNFLVLGLSLAFLTVLLVFNEYIKPKVAKRTRIPISMEFFLICLSIIISKVLDLETNYNIKTVGTVPSGFPCIVVPAFTLMPTIALDCLIIALVNITVNISLAKIFAKKGSYEVRDNQELLAYGISNMFGAFFQCLPVCASLSRSMVQFAVGGKTGMAHAVSLLSVMVILLFLGPIFEKVPLCVLATIVIATVKTLFMQITDFPKIWRNSKLDGAVWLVTFFSVIILDIDYGIGLGMTTSIITLVVRGVQADVIILGRDNKRIVDAQRYNVEEIGNKVLLLKIVGSVNFCNSVFVVRKVRKCLAEFRKKSQNEDGTYEITLIVDFSAVPYVDSSGVNNILVLYDIVKSQDCDMIITQCSPSIYHTFEKCGFFEKFPKLGIMVTSLAALEYVTKNYFDNSL